MASLLTRMNVIKNTRLLSRHCSSSVSRLTKVPDERKLLRELCGRIRLSGPIPVSEYMREVLTNPIHGVYQSDQVLGAGGHFVTSPEISQMFGECLGIWYVNEWMKMGEPKQIQIVELGPGKGTLLSDILRTLSRIRPDMLSGLSVHLVEVSDSMRKIQESEICRNDAKVTKIGDCPVSWYSSLRDVPKNFSFFLAHEFFDVLPVNKFEKTVDGWREVLLDIDQKSDNDQLRWVISRHKTPSCVLLDQLDPEVVNGRDKLEYCVQAGLIVKSISERIVEFGGAALVVDYGHEGDNGDTIRAFRHHNQVDPLELPGTADLTSDVDFRYLKSMTDQNSQWYGPVSQGDFLHSVGVTTRCQQLLSSSDESLHENILTAYDTLTNKDKMGERFKFAAIFPSTMNVLHSKYPPAGFPAPN